MEDSSNVKSPDTETPPQPKPTAKGAVKTRRRTPPQAAAVYRECLKNHAAGIGGLAMDGCGEFMPSSAAVDSDPSSLKCAACGCHRNFHRREVDDPSTAHFISFRRPLALPPPLNRSPSFSRSPSPPLLALSSGNPDDLSHHHRQKTLNRENPSEGKRFRTKFSHTQKIKMQAFAEKVGWKMNRHSERAVDEFCNEVGVSRGVLKVWIHNNKLSSRKMNNQIAENHVESGVFKNPDHENHQNECNTIARLHENHQNGSSSSS